MKLFSRVTNSFVMTAALLAVIVGSLCFSAGEGLRLTPFPLTALSQVDDSGTVADVGDTSSLLAKYGPLDVPAQKRGKRSSSDPVATSLTERESVFTFVVDTFEYDADALNLPLHLPRPSGRAPPVNS